jgi:hypothetical protein
MLQAVATLISLFAAAIAIAVIADVLREEWEAVRTALGFAPAPETLAPLPPRFREVTVRRGAMTRLVPPARVRAAL